MKYFELSHTDLNVSQIALGCMRISEMQLEEVETLIEKALSLGINFFDHADIYGNGKYEELFGQALAKHPEWREQMIIQTKCGIVRKQRYDFSKEHILSCVNESLKRLQDKNGMIFILPQERSFRKKKSNEISREIFIAFSFAYNLQ